MTTGSKRWTVCKTSNGVIKEYIVFPSSKPLLYIGIVSAVLAPIIGIILGIYFWSKPQLVKEGKIITLVALGWLAVISIDIFVF